MAGKAVKSSVSLTTATVGRASEVWFIEEGRSGLWRSGNRFERALASWSFGGASRSPGGGRWPSSGVDRPRACGSEQRTWQQSCWTGGRVPHDGRVRQCRLGALWLRDSRSPGGRLGPRPDRVRERKLACRQEEPRRGGCKQNRYSEQRPAREAWLAQLA